MARHQGEFDKRLTEIKQLIAQEDWIEAQWEAARLAHAAYPVSTHHFLQAGELRDEAIREHNERWPRKRKAA